MKISFLENLQYCKRALELVAIGSRGVNASISENERIGLPNVFGLKKIIFCRMPDGTITAKSPFKNK